MEEAEPEVQLLLSDNNITLTSSLETAPLEEDLSVEFSSYEEYTNQLFSWIESDTTKKKLLQNQADTIWKWYQTWISSDVENRPYSEEKNIDNLRTWNTISKQVDQLTTIDDWEEKTNWCLTGLTQWSDLYATRNYNNIDISERPLYLAKSQSIQDGWFGADEFYFNSHIETSNKYLLPQWEKKTAALILLQEKYPDALWIITELEYVEQKILSLQKQQKLIEEWNENFRDKRYQAEYLVKFKDEWEHYSMIPHIHPLSPQHQDNRPVT